MGIKNLLKFIRPSLKKGSIYKFKNSIFGVDMYCFIYKCLCYEDPMRHLRLYLDRIIRISRHTFLVFDGRAPEAKIQEQKYRETTLEKYIEKNPEKKVVKISAEFVKDIIREFQSRPKVTVIKSPEESDSQLAYMSLRNFIDVVITEDSDLIVYGCTKILFKLKPRGDCEIFSKESLEEFLPWDFKTFKWICILAGCDYLRGGLRGIGFMKSKKIFTKNIDSEEELFSTLKEKFNTPEEFFNNFKVAFKTFSHPWIYDYETDVCKRMNSKIIF